MSPKGQKEGSLTLDSLESGLYLVYGFEARLTSDITTVWTDCLTKLLQVHTTLLMASSFPALGCHQKQVNLGRCQGPLGLKGSTLFKLRLE